MSVVTAFIFPMTEWRAFSRPMRTHRLLKSRVNWMQRWRRCLPQQRPNEYRCKQGEKRMMNATLETKNKATVLQAFDTLFNRRDYAAAEKFWSPDYIQHSAHIPPGREGLFNLVKTLPPTLKYEPGTIVADGDFVIVHGRFSGFLPVNWIAADILRIEDGMLVEHWDVIQDEATREESKSKAPMFGTSFPRYPDRTSPA